MKEADVHYNTNRMGEGLDAIRIARGKQVLPLYLYNQSSRFSLCALCLSFLLCLCCLHSVDFKLTCPFIFIQIVQMSNVYSIHISLGLTIVE